jgi:hypothetical protein
LRYDGAMPSKGFARARYSAELLARVATGWRRLAEDERQRVIRTARLATELAELGAPPAVLTLAARVVRDEVRHVRVCATVVQELDGSPPPPLELAVGRPAPGLRSEAHVAEALVAELALGRPARAASLAAARARVREPLLARAYAKLLRDEARGEAFGARAAAWVLRDWPTDRRQALWARCLTARRADPTPRPRDPEAESLGLLPPDVDGRLPRWILPYLEPLGTRRRPANDLAFVN